MQIKAFCIRKMYSQIDLKRHVGHLSTYSQLMCGSPETRTVWSTSISRAAYIDDVDWQEFYILPYQLQLSVSKESERAQLKEPSYWPLTLLCGQEGLTYTGAKAASELFCSVALQSLHETQFLIFQENSIEALFCYFSKAALVTRES